MNQLVITAIEKTHLKISSPAFKNRGVIPVKYTCDGKNVNPPLHIDNIPESAKSLAIIMEDPDAPINSWVHWLVWNLPVKKTIHENVSYENEGVNDFQERIYVGPCPPNGTHRYFFKIFALDKLLNLPPSTEKMKLEKAMREHVVAYGELVGIYKRDGFKRKNYLVL
jgi:Raf kinase inhibitor-like YbhB/YbcL family protein